jgi:hypothetical protein
MPLDFGSLGILFWFMPDVVDGVEGDCFVESRAQRPSWLVHRHVHSEHCWYP